MLKEYNLLRLFEKTLHIHEQFINFYGSCMIENIAISVIVCLHITTIIIPVTIVTSAISTQSIQLRI